VLDLPNLIHPLTRIFQIFAIDMSQRERRWESQGHTLMCRAAMSQERQTNCDCERYCLLEMSRKRTAPKIHLFAAAHLQGHYSTRHCLCLRTSRSVRLKNAGSEMANNSRRPICESIEGLVYRHADWSGMSSTYRLCNFNTQSNERPTVLTTVWLIENEVVICHHYLLYGQIWSNLLDTMNVAWY